MSIMANTISKKVSKSMMKKSGLLRHAAKKGKTRIEIEYDSDSETGWMNVFIEDYEYDSHSESTEGTSGTQQSKETSCLMFHDNEAEAKMNWLKSIGAAAFPEPIKYIYTFPDYNGAFNLSERYIAEKTLEELKAQYEKNKEYAQEIIRSKKSQDALLRGAELL